MVETRIGDVGRVAWLPSRRAGAWVVLGFWLAVVAFAFVPSGKLAGAQENDNSTWLPAGAESTEVLERMEPFQSPDEIPALVVFERTGGLSRTDSAQVKALTQEIADLELVSRAPLGPFPSDDGEALQLVVPIDPGEGGWESLAEVAGEIDEVLLATPAGVDSFVTGPAGYAAESAKVFEGIDGRLLGMAASVVIVILLLTYRSPVLWILPMFSAGVALVVAQAVVYLAAEYAGLTVNAQAYSILTVLVFGAGADYALLLVARYREELRRHEDRHEAMAFALHRAGPAIWASGSTVIGGLLCLLLAVTASTRGMGPVAAIGIAVVLLVMLSLLPALLVILGRWVFWPIRPRYGTPDPAQTGIWARVGSRIAGRPRATWMVTALLLLVAAGFSVTLDADGLRQSEQYYGKPQPVLGEEALNRHFPAGSGQPVDVVADPARAAEVSDVVAAVPGIDQVQKPQVLDGVAWIAATLEMSPDTERARDTVRLVRERVHQVPGADAQAGGGTAIFMDILDASHTDNLRVIPAILLVVLMILIVLLRALVAPVVLIATVVLSFFAALGLSAILFEILGFAGEDPSLPLFVFVFLVALGIDYNIFLMTRVFEEAKEIGARRGALEGLTSTGGVITSAGLVLAGTFLSLATLPVVPFAQIGMAVALGVLLDTIVVRAVLVTALNLDLGKQMWWPARWARDDEELAATAESQHTLSSV